MDLLEDLAFRGLIHQQTNPDGLRAHLQSPRAVYCGFDPTRDSLTIGNLVPILLLRRFQQAGHRPVVIAGGGTGMIGDPSGKDAERQFLSLEQIDQNVAGQRPIFERLLDFSGANAAVILNNADWLKRVGYLEMLRDVGKYFSINMMIQKDSVRDRLEGREQGISYTEFSYMLLQAYDFVHLFDTQGCRLQLGGSDQWGNITEGIELIRRLRGDHAYGLTSPLLTLPGGGKMGKSVAGTVWLDPAKTSPYQFFQYWVRSEDEHVGTYLRRLTFLDRARIEELERATGEHPERREAQHVLAHELTALVH